VKHEEQASKPIVHEQPRRAIPQPVKHDPAAQHPAEPAPAPEREPQPAPVRHAAVQHKQVIPAKPEPAPVAEAKSISKPAVQPVPATEPKLQPAPAVQQKKSLTERATDLKQNVKILKENVKEAVAHDVKQDNTTVAGSVSTKVTRKFDPDWKQKSGDGPFHADYDGEESRPNRHSLKSAKPPTGAAKPRDTVMAVPTIDGGLGLAPKPAAAKPSLVEGVKKKAVTSQALVSQSGVDLIPAPKAKTSLAGLGYSFLFGGNEPMLRSQTLKAKRVTAFPWKQGRQPSPAQVPALHPRASHAKDVRGD
jgi:hypothetical protein